MFHLLGLHATAGGNIFIVFVDKQIPSKLYLSISVSPLKCNKPSKSLKRSHELLQVFKPPALPSLVVEKRLGAGFGGQSQHKGKGWRMGGWRKGEVEFF